MIARVRCHCRGMADCKLCHGKKEYDYEVGPLGWQIFPCPHCDQKGYVESVAGGETVRCPTCRGDGKVDPADPPPRGMWDVLCKIFFGA